MLATRATPASQPISPHARAAEGSREHAHTLVPPRQILCAVPAFGGEDPVIFMHSAVISRSLHRSLFCSAGVVADGPSRQLASEAHSCSRARASAVRSGSCAARSSTALTSSARAPDAASSSNPNGVPFSRAGNFAHRNVSALLRDAWAPPNPFHYPAYPGSSRSVSSQMGQHGAQFGAQVATSGVVHRPGTVGQQQA
jgi:hypothetical protein